jgi:hypothetical protein
MTLKRSSSADLPVTGGRRRESLYLYAMHTPKTRKGNNTFEWYTAYIHIYFVLIQFLMLYTYWCDIVLNNFLWSYTRAFTSYTLKTVQEVMGWWWQRSRAKMISDTWQSIRWSRDHKICWVVKNNLEIIQRPKYGFRQFIILYYDVHHILFDTLL